MVMIVRSTVREPIEDSYSYSSSTTADENWDGFSFEDDGPTARDLSPQSFPEEPPKPPVVHSVSGIIGKPLTMIKLKGV